MCMCVTVVQERLGSLEVHESLKTLKKWKLTLCYLFSDNYASVKY